MTLSGKDRGELVKLHFKNGMNVSEALRVNHQNYLQKSIGIFDTRVKSGCTLQSLRDLEKKFKDTGYTCDKPLFMGTMLEKCITQ